MILSALFMQGQVKGSGSYFLSGIVRDSLTRQPVAYASVASPESAAGVLTDENGLFEITLPHKASELQVACLGYDKKVVPIKKGKVNLYDIALSPSAFQLQEVVVRKQKYSKKNNPAVDLMRKLKESGDDNDPRRNPYYSYNKHEIATMALNDFAKRDDNSWMFKKFPFLWDYVDTSEVSGRPILNVIVKERASEVHYRKSPKSEKEVVTGIRQEGLDEIADQNNMLAFTQDMLREIDLYANDINILQNRFVSPLSKIAPDFYRFYLNDTVEIEGEKFIALSFYPRNPAAFGFNGQIFIPANDSTLFIKKVTMRTPRKINLNFIENLYISQEYEKAADGSRLKKSDDMTMEIKVAKGTPGLYVRRSVAYDGHDFSKPADESLFSGLGDELTVDSAKVRDSAFWEARRIASVSDNEKEVGTLMEQLRSVPAYYWAEKFLKVMFTGYVATGDRSKFDYGPLNTTISHNDLEGWRLRAGGMTTANLSKRWFGRGYVAYGLKDHKWKYKAEAEYSFIDKEYHSREFPMHSLRFTSLYDVDQIGQQYAFTNNDNFFLSLRRMSDLKMTYHHVNKLEYNLELRNNLSVNATIGNERQISTPFVPFVDGRGMTYRDYVENSLEVTLRYAKGEKFYQGKNIRIPVNLDAPIITLRHTIAPKGWLGSTFAINRTELSVQKRMWFSAFGYADAIVKGGHVWSRSPYPSLMIPNANLSYTIQPESYVLMNPMEFINDSYASIDLTYWANGAILNYVPVVKTLKLREVFAFRGLWGSLSHRNDPSENESLLRFPAGTNARPMSWRRPYMEASVGLDNIFRCLRVDYVWRLSYLDVPYEIDRHGLRVSMHLAF